MRSRTREAQATKKSTANGEAKDKIIAALTKHHDYANGSCLNLEPIGCNELGRRADVSGGTASNFFKTAFGDHRTYSAICRDPSKLAKYLKQLNDEYSPHELFGKTPPAEGGDDEE